MNLLANITNALKKSKATGREAYLRALSQNKPPAEIVRLAVAAGIPDAEIAADAEVVDKASALVEAVADYPTLTKRLADANTRHAAIESEYNGVVTKFSEQLSAAGSEVEAAGEAERPARKALNDLADLYRRHAEILPPAPPAVSELLRAQDRLVEIAESRERVRLARSKAGNIERDLLTARNEASHPGILTVNRFEPAAKSGMVPTIRQPVLAGVDDAHVQGEQSAIQNLQAELAKATADAEKSAAAHRVQFGEEAR